MTSSLAKIEEVGRVYGRLIVYSAPAVNPRNGLRMYLCLCLCGTFFEATGASLRRSTRSCGCLTSERMTARNLTHGMHGTPEYKSWRAMIQRCEWQMGKDWHLYGGRGISVCKKWRESFAAFFADMGKRPSLKHSLDRIDVNGHYEPGNCRWASTVEQALNKRPRRDGRRPE